MKSLQGLMHSIFLVCVCSSIFALGQIYDQPTCSLTIARDIKLFDKLARIFDRDSNTIILEYTVKIRQDSGECISYENSNPDSFQPWKWYRTQGFGNSHVLQTFEFYFGLLKKILDLGMEKVELCLDVYPPGCLQGNHFETTDTLIRNFLLHDLDIADQSLSWDVAKADTVEVCTARIYAVNGGGNLVYRCCSYNKWKEIICDDDSSDGWANVLNICILVVSVLVSAVVAAFDIKQSWSAKECSDQDIYKYTFEKKFNILIYNKKSIETVPGKTKCIFGEMENVKSKLDSLDKDVVLTISETCLNVHKDKLLKDPKGLFFLIESCFNGPSWCRKIKEKVTGEKVSSSTIILIFLSISGLPIFVLTWFGVETINLLLETFNKIGLRGPYYLDWGFNQLANSILITLFYAVFVVTSIVNVILSFCCRNECVRKYFKIVWTLLSFFSALSGTIFILSALIMFVFTVIVQVQIWKIIIQVFLTLLIYAIPFYNNFWNDHVNLKARILELFQKESQFKADKTVTAITTENLDNALKILNSEVKNIKRNNGSDEDSEELKQDDIQATDSCSGKAPNPDESYSVEFKIENDSLLLINKGPFLFLDEKDVPAITKEFFSRCLEMDCRGMPEKLTFVKAFKLLRGAFFTASFISLVVFSVFAYGDFYHISPFNRVFVSFLTTILPLVAQHLLGKGSSVNTDPYLDRKFYVELRKAIADFKETVIVNDFIKFNIRYAESNENNIIWKTEYDFAKGKQVATLKETVTHTPDPETSASSSKGYQQMRPTDCKVIEIETKP